jgi:hypothetical protein
MRRISTMDNLYKEENSDNNTATEDSDDYTATARKLFNANPLQHITTANKLFNANPFECISKETDNFPATNCKKQKKLQHQQCINFVTQDNIASFQDLIQDLHDIGKCFDYKDKTLRDCECVEKLSKDDIWDGSIFLVSLANQ